MKINVLQIYLRMKILKIELQNIHSIQSDTPVVIDFQHDRFRNVGIYAITGNTGSGKTTLLDAITVALYHRLPRFSEANPDLSKIVSHGAESAFCRITFESQSVSYEALWTIRMRQKNGKKLGNPDEKVRLINLETNQILVEQKKAFRAEIEQITKLNYEQFLRSVMLAQGEFAAFLNAKNAEKGELLEQITGEDIYKKIGETLTLRINSEKKILDELKAKINTEDILSDSQELEYQSEISNILPEIQRFESEIKLAEQKAKWYENEAKLTQQKKTLTQELENFELQKSKNASILEQLSFHKKAEPFRNNFTELGRLENEISKKIN